MKNVTCICIAAAVAALAVQSGCLSVKTEHEVKPIQITMDVNLKVDKALEQELENEKKEPPKHFEQVKAMFKRGAAGMDNRGYIAVRGDLSDEEKEIVEETNARRRVRMGELADQTGAKRADVEKKRAEKMVERLSEGAWYQDAEGKWLQKK